MSDMSPVWRHLEALGIGTTAPALLYFADPMCSWCWGFSPVIAELAKRYGSTISFQCVMGGLRAGNTVPTDAAFREEILHHWRSVHARTGQPFAFEDALPDGFIYDTEPPCRAVVAANQLNFKGILDFLHALQNAFYAARCDITRTEELVNIAKQQGIDHDGFLEMFHLPKTLAQTEANFQFTRDFGVRGFPTIVLLGKDSASLLTAGYVPIDELTARVDSWLDGLGETDVRGTNTKAMD